MLHLNANQLPTWDDLQAIYTRLKQEDLRWAQTEASTTAVPDSKIVGTDVAALNTNMYNMFTAIKTAVAPYFNDLPQAAQVSATASVATNGIAATILTPKKITAAGLSNIATDLNRIGQITCGFSGSLVCSLFNTCSDFSDATVNTRFSVSFSSVFGFTTADGGCFGHSGDKSHTHTTAQTKFFNPYPEEHPEMAGCGAVCSLGYYAAGDSRCMAGYCSTYAYEPIV